MIDHHEQCRSAAAESGTNHRKLHRRTNARNRRRIRRALVRRDGACCRGCGARATPLTRDHIIPLSRGGTDRIANQILLCIDCNRAKRNLLPHEPGWPEHLEALRRDLADLLEAQAA